MANLKRTHDQHLKGRHTKLTGVRCNCVRHAILSTPDTFAYAIVSGVMQKPSGGHVHDCMMCARKRACMHWTYTYAQHEYSRVFFMIAANTQQPNISHVIHDTHLACKMANVFRRPRAFNLLQERFFTGADTAAYANVSGGHNCMLQQRPGGHDCICKTVRVTLLHMQ